MRSLCWYQRLHKQSEPLYLTTDNQSMYTTTTLQIYDSWRLSQMFRGYYICKIMVVIACFLIQADVTPSSVVNNARSWSYQLARDNLTNVFQLFCNQANHAVAKTCFCSVIADYDVQQSCQSILEGTQHFKRWPKSIYAFKLRTVLENVLKSPQLAMQISLHSWCRL